MQIVRVVVLSALVWIVVVLVKQPDPQRAVRDLVGFIILGLIIYALYRLLEKIYKVR